MGNADSKNKDKKLKKCGNKHVFAQIMLCADEGCKTNIC
jgi:hypothetical protein